MRHTNSYHEQRIVFACALNWMGWSDPIVIGKANAQTLYACCSYNCRSKVRISDEDCLHHYNLVLRVPGTLYWSTIVLRSTTVRKFALGLVADLCIVSSEMTKSNANTVSAIAAIPVPLFTYMLSDEISRLYSLDLVSPVCAPGCRKNMQRLHGPVL